MRAIIHQVIKFIDSPSCSSIFVLRGCYDFEKKSNGDILDLWETTVGRRPKSKCGHDASSKANEGDIIAASDIFGGHGRYEKMQISSTGEVVPVSSCSPACQSELLIAPTGRR